VLTAALDGAPEAPDEWKSAARALLVYSLAGDGKEKEAARVLEKMSAGRPGPLLTMSRGLSQIAAGADPKVRAKLAELQLRAIEMLGAHRDVLTEEDVRQVRRIQAMALADTGQTSKALGEFRALAAEYPRDGEIQEGYAGLLLEKADRASLETALAAWRRIAKNSPQGSDRWFRAKYSVALAHFRLNNRAMAARIITQVEILHPELGGAEMGKRFRRLLGQCQP